MLLDLIVRIVEDYHQTGLLLAALYGLFKIDRRVLSIEVGLGIKK